MSNSTQKYAPFRPVDLPRRSWPAQSIDAAPRWCSVDLRDGNQALPIPMGSDEKRELFDLLVDIGFKEIEICYPTASDADRAFVRKLIEENRIPDDVAIQVVAPCEDSLISKTFQAVEGAKRVIFHFLNSTSPVQREAVYKADKRATIALAVGAAKTIRRLGGKARENGMNLTFEYTPESFTETEPEFALQIVESVLDALEASASDPAIINLPATVEKCMPNHYADLIEWIRVNIDTPERFILSVHPHNDRGCAVAAAELAILAGARRVEGTLFGNGERTGNVDLLTLALNLYTQGIDPGLDVGDINRIRDVYQRTTHLPIGPRHPYAGEFVYTAFSGAYQDAILKSINYRKKHKAQPWQIPYLPLDPADVGREYEPIIRINSQSGKSGPGFVLEKNFGYKIPSAMLPELGRIVKEAADREKAEITAGSLLDMFSREFIRAETPYELKSYRTSYLNEEDEEDNEVLFSGVINVHGEPEEVQGRGNGPIDALYDALKSIGAADYDFISYDQHALSGGSDSRAVAYIQLRNKKGATCFGVGTSRDIRKASLRALISAVNRMSKASG